MGGLPPVTIICSYGCPNNSLWTTKQIARGWGGEGRGGGWVERQRENRRGMKEGIKFLRVFKQLL